MKHLYIFCSLAFGILIFSQEAGKKGELLKNEATKAEMQTKKNNNSSNTNRGNNPLNNSGYKNQNNYPQYNWNQNFGYSEVFLRIPEMGYFTVEIGNQIISNSTGKFRFFDLSSGRMPLSIYRNDFLIYRSQINLQNQSRMVLDFFTRNGLFLLDHYPVQNQYTFNQWDDVWNNPYNNSNGYENQNYNNYGNVLNSTEFSNFLNAYKNNSFDSNKLNFVQAQARNTLFTSQQIAIMMKEMSFEQNRIQLAKTLFRNCVDKQNFYIVYESLDFESSRRELMSYISNL